MVLFEATLHRPLEPRSIVPETVMMYFVDDAA